jgi:trehalose 6-phosphate synthase/phosphatase
MNVDILESYANSTKRLFLLDYDGTLVNIMPTPPEAKPSADILTVLQRLAEDKQNTVVIISGRDHETLDAWLGDLPLSFVAEHGLFYKEPGQKWTSTTTVDTSWKPAVRQLMETYTKRLDGTFIEEKTNALGWHYRTAPDTAEAEGFQKELSAKLEPLAASLGLRIIYGTKVYEVHPVGFHKGMAAKQFLERAPWDFVLAAGDDTTDEDLFKAMPTSAFSIKVRPGPTAARMRLETPADMLELLNSLASTPA